jgi:hypothetical protein
MYARRVRVQRFERMTAGESFILLDSRSPARSLAAFRDADDRPAMGAELEFPAAVVCNAQRIRDQSESMTGTTIAAFGSRPHSRFLYRMPGQS